MYVYMYIIYICVYIYIGYYMITCVNMILIQVYVCKSGWCLVVEAYPLKHMKLIGMMTFITGGKMKNVPNHQPVYENID